VSLITYIHIHLYLLDGLGILVLSGMYDVVIGFGVWYECGGGVEDCRAASVACLEMSPGI